MKRGGGKERVVRAGLNGVLVQSEAEGRCAGLNIERRNLCAGESVTSMFDVQRLRHP